jgi:hypothetical protein
LRFWLVAAGAQKNPRPSASRGFLSKLSLPSTSASGGVAYDDDQQRYLPNNHYHGAEYSKTAETRQAPIAKGQI